MRCNQKEIGAARSKATETMKSIKSYLAALLLFATPAAAEIELSFYLGAQGVSESNMSGVLPGGAGVARGMNWEGKPFEAPIYYGARAMWWTQNQIGFGIEGTHTKAYASAADLAFLGLGRFELSDGHNIITANIMKRWPGAFNLGSLTPYAGAGVGVAIPHVDAQVLGVANRTYDYEVTGPAVRGIFGVKYDLNEKWAVFGEYQFTWSDNDITIDPNIAVPGQTPGQFNTEIVTHALNFGISYSF